MMASVERWMPFCLGTLGWPPSEFWQATHFEASNAFAGYCQKEGIGAWARDGNNFTRDEAMELLEWQREQQAAEKRQRADGD